MSDSKLLIPLGKAVTVSANSLGNLQVGIDKILWGSITPSTRISANLDTKTGNITYTPVTTAPKPPTGNLVESGLFNALDVLNSVDLCDILSYLTDTIHLKNKPRPSKPWNAAQTAFYGLQDAAQSVQKQIDKFMAYPNVLIGDYVGIGPNAVPLEQAVDKGAPTQGGTSTTAYNLFFLMKSIKETFSLTGTNSIFTAEEKTILTTVPGLGGSLNFIDDFIGTVDKYSDYRNIPNKDLQDLIDKVNKLRSICVTIQNLDFKSALSLVGNFLGVDIRSQIQKLGAFLDPTKLIPTLKEINNALRGFIKIAQQVQGVLSLGQFLIKLALIFNKIFKFIIQFFLSNPAPGMSLTAGVISRFEDAKGKAKSETDGVTILLRTINSLMGVVVTFIRYVLGNTNELLSRLDILLAKLEGCAAVKDSDVISELKQTRDDLVALREQLTTYVTQYDSKTNSDNSMFGKYDIRVVDEELVDKTITNKRRRGIALDTDGRIVTESDLTFATNTAVIISEVQQKLIALGLVGAGVGQLDMASLGVIADSINYLDSNDIAENDLNINTSAQNSANTVEQLGISTFIEQLPGGSKFKQNSKTVMTAYTTGAKEQAAKQRTVNSKLTVENKSK